MNDLAIVCFSCDLNDEVWPTFMTCLDKYWPNHPVTYLFTETLDSPLMKTINHDFELDEWTTRIYLSLQDIPEEKVIFICDDCFLDNYVNLDKLKECYDIVNNNANVAYVNLELSFDSNDLDCEYEGFKKKGPNSSFTLSLLCGLWDKKKLMDILNIMVCSPWHLEASQNVLNYDVYQVDKVKALSWFRDGPKQCGAKYGGRWAKTLPAFLEKEGIEMDLLKKGFNNSE